MNNIRFGKKDIITNPTHIKMIIGQYYKQLYANKFDSSLPLLTLRVGVCFPSPAV